MKEVEERTLWLLHHGIDSACFFPPDVEKLFLDGRQKDENLWELLIDYFREIADAHEILNRSYKSSGKRFLRGLERLKKKSIAGKGKFLQKLKKGGE